MVNAVLVFPFYFLTVRIYDEIALISRMCGLAYGFFLVSVIVISFLFIFFSDLRLLSLS